MTDDTTSTIDDHGRREPPMAGDEATMVRAFLTYQRDTIAWKVRGLDDAALRQTTAASTMTLGGLLKHLAFVEDYWCRYRLAGLAPSPPFLTADWDADPDWDWHSAGDDTAEDLHALWQRSIAGADEQIDSALAAGGLGHPASEAWPDGTSPTLRWILLHLVEEYARHVGHADLLREAIDGETGE